MGGSLVREGLRSEGRRGRWTSPRGHCSLVPEKIEGDSPSCCKVGVTDCPWCVDLGETLGFSAASRSDFLIKVYGVRRLSPLGRHGTQEQVTWSSFPSVSHGPPATTAPTHGQAASVAVIGHSDTGRL